MHQYCQWHKDSVLEIVPLPSTSNSSEIIKSQHARERVQLQQKKPAKVALKTHLFEVKAYIYVVR